MTERKEWDELTPQGIIQRMNAEERAAEVENAFMGMVKESTEKLLVKNEGFSVVADIVTGVLVCHDCYKGRGRKFNNFFKAAASGDYQKAAKLVKIAMFFGYCEGVRKAKRDKEQAVFKDKTERKPKKTAAKTEQPEVTGGLFDDVTTAQENAPCAGSGDEAAQGVAKHDCRGCE